MSGMSVASGRTTKTGATGDGEETSWILDVVVRDKCIKVTCGDATQRVRWLGHVGIARYDEKNYQGWKILGVPTKITNREGLRRDDHGRVDDREHVPERVSSTVYARSRTPTTERASAERTSPQRSRRERWPRCA